MVGGRWIAAAVAGAALIVNLASAVPPPGGLMEPQGAATRLRWSESFLRSFIPPSRGPFTFPPPYNTSAVRITDASDCAGRDCVWYVGYSYWRNTNAHEGSDRMLIFLGLAPERGGSGPTLFSYDKIADHVTKVGPVFPPGHRLAQRAGGGWYFSAGRPTALYVDDGPRLLRYDVESKEAETVFDVSWAFGADRTIHQAHSSNDDLTHSATLQVANTGEFLGCLVYSEADRRFRFYPKIGVFDECHLDKSGRWTLSLEDLGVPGDVAMRIFDNETGQETRIEGPEGTLGHLDTGYGYAIGADDFNPLPNATIRWSFDPAVRRGPVLHRNRDRTLLAVNHPSHANAKPDVPLSAQYACGSNTDRNYAVQNEIICFRIDGSPDQLVVAPVMTDPEASGGCCDAYAKYPKGNLDISGRYFVWTTNLGGNRMDAFLVHVPAERLTDASTNAAPLEDSGRSRHAGSETGPHAHPAETAAPPAAESEAHAAEESH